MLLLIVETGQHTGCIRLDAMGVRMPLRQEQCIYFWCEDKNKSESIKIISCYLVGWLSIEIGLCFRNWGKPNRKGRSAGGAKGRRWAHGTEEGWSARGPPRPGPGRLPTGTQAAAVPHHPPDSQTHTKSAPCPGPQPKELSSFTAHVESGRR